MPRRPPSVRPRRPRPLLPLLLLLAAAAAPGLATVFDEATSLRILNYTWSSFCPRDQLKPWRCQWCVGGEGMFLFFWRAPQPQPRLNPPLPAWLAGARAGAPTRA